MRRLHWLATALGVTPALLWGPSVTAVEVNPPLEGRIVQIEKQAPPLTPTGPERICTATADQVLEVPAGFTSEQ